MDKSVKIAIIGAGTAGLSAYKEARKYTQDILLIDKGPLGSTCARVGCMPSKLLIHVANQFYERHNFGALGIQGANQLQINIPKSLDYVRKLRDKFTAGIIDFIESLGKHFLFGEASFVNSNILKVNKQRIFADKIIIATGSSSIIPDDWLIDHSKVLTSETLFEQERFAKSIGIIGGGIIGLELGQALSRLNIQISLYHADSLIGSLTDPEVNEVAVRRLKKELSIYLNERISIITNHDNNFSIKTSSKQDIVEGVLSAIGQKPNLKNLELENLNIEFDEQSKIPKYDKSTMQINNQPIFIAGDVNKTRPLLHEAADEGRIAGFNAANMENKHCFKRRVPIRILFTQPNIAVVGQSFSKLKHDDCVIGEVRYDNQGRAKIENQNDGILRVYGSKITGKLLGAECIAPAGEHIAHLLAWAIQQELTVFEILQMPFYHPVIEEGIRTALRDMSKKIKSKAKSFELTMCDSEAIHSLT